MSDEHERTAISSAARSELFDDSVAALDAATRSRLTQARYRALEERKSAARGALALVARSRRDAGRDGARRVV